MSQELYSVEQVAERLGLHVKTVRTYVRDGRLKATRIGKQYRIAREDLESFTGQPASEVVQRTRHVNVSSIVEIDAIDRETTIRISNGLSGAANGRPAESQPLRIDTIYDEQRARLKIILTGSIDTTAWLMRLIDLYLESSP